MDRHGGDYDGDPYHRPRHYPSDDFHYPHHHHPPPPPPHHHHPHQQPPPQQQQQFYDDYPDHHPHPPPYDGPDPDFDPHYGQPQHHPHPHHVPGDFDGPFYGGGGGFHPSDNGGGGGYGGPMPFSGRKRGRTDAMGLAKLYVAEVPRTAAREDIQPLFEQYGHVVEVVLLWDKRTRQQQGSCFVKYATLEEADRAIIALNNKYTFPGEGSAVKVRYADGERERLAPPQPFPPVKVRHADGEQERLGHVVDKLYVGGLNKQASKLEIEEIFAPYGVVEEVYIVRDELKHSRGCAFVKYSHRDMALAAIKALSGNFTMRGCELPLIVRFADPKKPRNGEPRPTRNFGEPIGGSIAPSAPITKQQISTHSQPVAVSQIVDRGTADDGMMQNPFPMAQPASSEISQKYVQTAQIPEVTGSSQPSAPQAQKQPHVLPQSTQNSEQRHSFQSIRQESPRSRDNPQAVPSTSGLSPAFIEMEDLECDWSQHVCPDGNKYYYNCVSLESTLAAVG
ncbi:hypothetical protein EUGRSUZ_H00995 [Eucalyptus grandis]|uniref:Uncharacterized protein n=2 Tax=Eucalyptus grandis TaxID=71139 RepID=A0ACC3JNS6_EUCGR|nr:hypothetical protein EUGRSUZ_H00995 [Eucalyptus grandis]